MTHGIYEFGVPLPITQAAQLRAQEFANQQRTSHKADQVRLNTLAVMVMHDYLQLMDIPTDLSASDSWNAVIRATTDVADLELPGVGRLECRPVRPAAATYVVPPETWEDRVGYVVLQVDESSQEAQLLGFVPIATEEELPLSELRSPEELLDHLYELRQTVAGSVGSTAAIADTLATIERGLSNLGLWLQGVIEESWQAAETILNPTQLSPAYAFRNQRSIIRQAKRFNLGPQEVALVVEVQPGTGDQREIQLQLHPTDGQNRLPVGAQLRVLDEVGALVIVALANGSEDFLELQVEGEPGESFSVQITLDEIQITQEFVI